MANTGRIHNQIWERNSLSVDLWTQAVFEQKLQYIHNKPIQNKWQLAQYPEDYRYSSAKFYQTDIDDFGLLTTTQAINP